MIDYEEDWLMPLLFKREGTVAHRAVLFAIPAAILSVLLIMIDDWAPTYREQSGLNQASGSQLWAATTAVLASLVTFRTNKAYGRFWEGTSLLHMMRGEWFDSVSCCITFSRSAKGEKPREVEDFRHTMVRLMSLCHGSALEEIAGIDRGMLPSIDALGLDNPTLKHLNDCAEVYEFNRVEVLLHLQQSLIIKALDSGVLKIAPPILSRVFQTLSRGFVNLLNCKKIADTRFPFPYAQVIAILLYFHAINTPLLISNVFTGSAWSYFWAPVFTFMPVFGLHSLNAVAIELENPFGDDDNDLPLDHFQHEMNACLMMLVQDNADLIAGVRTTCCKDYSKIKEALDNYDPDEEGEDGERINGSFALVDDVPLEEEEEETKKPEAQKEEKKPAAAPPPAPPKAAALPPEVIAVAKWEPLKPDSVQTVHVSVAGADPQKNAATLAPCDSAEVGLHATKAQSQAPHVMDGMAKPDGNGIPINGDIGIHTNGGGAPPDAAKGETSGDDKHHGMNGSLDPGDGESPLRRSQQHDLMNPHAMELPAGFAAIQQTIPPFTSSKAVPRQPDLAAGHLIKPSVPPVFPEF
eukprot:TRINITY_DN2142_c0_g3_i1.p1 TRINITY_DN2142_c0_g3~~TRINITY_DN2142_c0_g3_i1.p1  ORF type:complete len:579 (-),score=144.44 TRINITY_DN2142_c0_g3_i1:292-2028(-)